MSFMNSRFQLYVIIASGCWMFGEGARMVVEAVKGDSVYVPRLDGIDVWFDWLPLVVLGSLLFYWGVKEFHLGLVEKEKRGRAMGAARDSSSVAPSDFRPTSALRRR